MLRMKLAAQRTNRQLLLLLLILGVLILGGVAEYRRNPIALSEWGGPLINILPALLDLFIRLLPGAVINTIPTLAALAVIPWLASRFIHALYATKDRKQAHEWLQDNVFGMQRLRPIVIVKEGDIAVGGGSLHDRAGGRAFMIVYNESAVVLEQGGRLTRVLGGPQFCFLNRFERIWEIVDLRPQRWLFTDDAMSKEGIPISCEADVTFKIDDRYIDQDGSVQVKSPIDTQNLPIDEAIVAELAKTGSISKPLPYTEDAVFKAATAIWVRIKQTDHQEQLRKWTGRVMISEVEGDLRNILAQYRINWLLQPPQSGQQHPREEIREQLDQKLRGKLQAGNNLGAKILSVDLGKVDVKNDRVYTQWVEAWQAGWEQRAIETRAEGEAELTRLQAAQVYAQAEMVLALTEAIRPLVTDAEEVPSYLLAMRFVETLWWMSYAPWMRAFLPPETMRTLDQLEKMCKIGSASGTAGSAVSEIDRVVRERRQ